jgi:hypothetical protein
MGLNMKKLITTTFFSLMLIGFAGNSSAQLGLFGPSNYDDCILENLQDVTSDVAARAIMRSCRAKFPPPQPPPKNILSFDYKGARDNGYTHQEIVTYFTEGYTIREMESALTLMREDSSLASPDHRRAIIGAIQESSN